MTSRSTAPSPGDPTPRSPALPFIVASLALFVAIDLAADVLARVAIRGQPLALAAGEHLHYAVTQLAGSAFLSLPYVGLALIGLPLLRRRGALAGALFLLCGAALLGGVAEFGYRQSELAMLDRHWTSAALTMALIPILSLPVLLVAFVVRWLATRTWTRGRP